MPVPLLDRTHQRAELARCRALLKDGSRTFLAASRLLPPRVADAACALYAFCRTADDLVDRPGSAYRAVDVMSERLERIYLGRPDQAAPDRAFARVVERYDLPRALPDALIDGFRWDAEARRYRSVGDLQEYAARVAGSVGAMMAVIMGVRHAADVERACSLGVAMQLSNIARDVGDDARLGRIYLPLDWLHGANIDPDELAATPRFSASLAEVIARLLSEAEGLYARAAAGVAGLPKSCRPAIELARILYAEIGHEVARQGYDSVSRRAVVSAGRKAQVAVRGLSTVPFRRRGHDLEPLPATRFLVEACAARMATREQTARSANQSELATGLDRQAAWLVDLFVRLERRESRGRPAPYARLATLRTPTLR